MHRKPEFQNSHSFALKAGHELRKCAELVRNSALKHAEEYHYAT
jgi:tryptophan synthase alpha subunit